MERDRTVSLIYKWKWKNLPMIKLPITGKQSQMKVRRAELGLKYEDISESSKKGSQLTTNNNIKNF